MPGRGPRELERLEKRTKKRRTLKKSSKKQGLKSQVIGIKKSKYQGEGGIDTHTKTHEKKKGDTPKKNRTPFLDQRCSYIKREN